uniref:uncharacterized protein LOC105350064 n=1 Tax=Fragaria vesca subsp. vesca TaxID=101020 RepID=UPI0005C90331|nr:PREDICTED: uncharacterized protein LOC105350064 [Fragaria vesca subsp. vesca]
MMHDVSNYDSYFVQKPNASGRNGFSIKQKLTCAMRMFAYGLPADLCDKFLDVAESTALKILSHFTRAIWKVYHKHYLRRPSKAGLRRLLNVADKRGFPGMVGSLDCMHWQWKNCPTSWQGHFTCYKGKPKIILEAVASYDTWIWHAYFGLPGSLNDINVLGQSPLFDEVCRDERDETGDNHEVDPDEVPTRPRRVEIYDHYEVDHLVECDPPALREFMRRYQQVRCPIVHKSLQEDLVNHLWNVKQQAEQNRM